MSHREAYDAFHEEREQRSTSLPMRGIVETVSSDIESVSVDMAHTPGRPVLVVRHPYFGVNSWIRTMPEPGTAVLTQRRGDLHREEIWGYISNTLPRQVQQSKQRQALIRRLNQGEIEIRSRGRAYAFWGTAGELELFGGPVQLELNPTRMEVSSIAPTHKRRLMLHDPTTINNEERFGLVRRPDQANLQAAPTLQTFTRLSAQGEFAQEYLRFMARENGNVVSQYQEGDVVQADGTFETLSITNKNLRLKHVLGHVNGNDKLTYAVDESLNVLIQNSTSANTEMNIQLGSNNTLKLTTKIAKVTVSQTGTLNFDTGLTIKTPQATVNSSNVTFGNTGSQQAILGTTLVNSILTPAFTIIGAAFQTLSADPALSSATKGAMTGFQTSLSGIAASLSNALSQQVKLSG